MGDIPATYAGAWMRWALYLHDHPKAAEPTFEVVSGDDSRVAMPAAFLADPSTGEVPALQYVVCTIDPRDGGRAETAWKDIPLTERIYGKDRPFARTPDNWRKVCAGALGRALKELGYPDDTRELQAVIAWRRRDIELRALAAGGPVAELSPAPPVQVAEAGRPDGADEHPDTREEEPTDAEVVPTPEQEWSTEAAEKLRPIIAQLDVDSVAAVKARCESRNLGPYEALTGSALRGVVAYARGLVRKPPPETSGTPPPVPDPAPTVPEASHGPDSGAGGGPVRTLGDEASARGVAPDGTNTHDEPCTAWCHQLIPSGQGRRDDRGEWAHIKPCLDEMAAELVGDRQTHG